MSVRSAQAVTVEFVTSSPSTGAATTADSLPTGTLVVNGTDNAATVTVTLADAGRYKAAVTLPTLAAGDVVELAVAATVAAVAGKGIVWRDTKDVLLDASGLVSLPAAYDPAKTAAQAGDAMALTAAERDAVAAALLALADGVETGLTLKQALRLLAAGVGGKRSNCGTAAEQYDAAGNPGTARIVGNLDSSGNGQPTLTP
jgi:hypothetical protein